MVKIRNSETVTENIFRGYYGPKTFIEKSAIPTYYGFASKKGTDYVGYPDFFLEEEEYCIVVEAKALNHSKAQEEVKYYIANNRINKDIVGIAVSGQSLDTIAVTYYLRLCHNKWLIFDEK